MAHALRGEGFDASEDGTGRGTPLMPVHIVGALACNTGPNGHDAGNFACNQSVDAGHVIPVLFQVDNSNTASPDANSPPPAIVFDNSEDGTGRGTPLIPAIVGQAMSSKWAKGTAGPAGDEHHNLIPVPFDTTQITSPGNYSAPKPGDPCHPLAAGAHAPCIAFPERLSGTQCASSENLSPALGALNPTVIAIQANADAAPNRGPGGKGWRDDGVAYTLEAQHRMQAVAFAQNQRDEVRTMDIAGALAAEPGAKQQTYAMQGMAVRHLTPTECERLQGFTDGHTNVPHRGKPAADGPRYKALGNSWAVNCARWIGERVQQVEAIPC